jgi:hypothetical protein
VVVAPRRNHRPSINNSGQQKRRLYASVLLRSVVGVELVPCGASRLATHLTPMSVTSEIGGSFVKGEIDVPGLSDRIGKAE